MLNGTAILIDFDNTTYTISPAAIEKIAVLVPDWNMPQITKTNTMAKNIRSLLNFVVMAKIMIAAADAAALQPYDAASLNVEKYRMSVPALSTCVDNPLVHNQVNSVGVKPILTCFQVQIAEKRTKHAHIMIYLSRFWGVEI